MPKGGDGLAVAVCRAGPVGLVDPTRSGPLIDHAHNAMRGPVDDHAMMVDDGVVVFLVSRDRIYSDGLGQHAAPQPEPGDSNRVTPKNVIAPKRFPTARA